MELTKKVKTISAIGTTFMLSVLAGVGMMTAPVQAAAANEQPTFYIAGASIRKAQTAAVDKDYNGIRFPIQLEKSYYDTNKANITEISVTLTLDDATANVVTRDLTETMQNAVAAEEIVEVNSTQYYQAYVYVYNIDADKYDCDITAQAFLTNGTQTLETESCTRSMQYVAKVAFDDGESGVDKYLPTYQLTFMESENNSAVVPLKYGETLPSSDDIFFEGWYTAQNGGTKVEKVDGNIAGDMTLYAQYNAVAGASQIDSVTKDTSITYGEEAFSYKIDVQGQQPQISVVGNRAKPFTPIAKNQKATVYINTTNNCNGGVKVTLYNEYDADSKTERFIRTQTNTWVPFTLTAAEYNALVTGENKIYMPWLYEYTGDDQYFYISDFYIDTLDAVTIASVQYPDVKSITKDSTRVYGNDEYSYKLTASGQHAKFGVNGVEIDSTKKVVFYIYTTNGGVPIKENTCTTTFGVTVANEWAQMTVSAEEYNAMVRGEKYFQMNYIKDTTKGMDFYISDFYIVDAN
jgi:hypothetical protein